MNTVIIGLGEAGAGIHLEAARTTPSVRLVGACDPDEARRARASALGVPTFPDLEALLASTAPELAIVATPPATHAPLCLRLLDAGAHVLCEKPFTTTAGEADQVMAAARARGRRVALNHEFREMPIFRALLDEVRGDGPDRLTFLQIWQLMNLPPGGESGWRGALRHRTLFEAGVHLVDLAVAMFGGFPDSVQASTSSVGFDADVDAVALVTLEFSGGRLAHITQDRVSTGTRQYFEVRADTPAASLRASFGGRSRLSAGLFRSTRPHLRFEHGLSGLAWKEIGDRRVRLASNPARPLVAATRAVLEQTVDAFRRGTPAPTEARHAAEIGRLITAAYDSASEGRRLPFEASKATESAGG